ncbi:MAG: hypothetical protein WD153_03170 [Candidatus Paceibacterota bacterium]
MAFASFVLDSKWYAGNVAVYTRPGGGYRLVYPTKKIGERNIEIFHPISKEVGDEVEKEVIRRLEHINRAEETNA